MNELLEKYYQLVKRLMELDATIEGLQARIDHPNTNDNERKASEKALSKKRNTRDAIVKESGDMVDSLRQQGIADHAMRAYVVRRLNEDGHDVGTQNHVPEENSVNFDFTDFFNQFFGPRDARPSSNKSAGPPPPPPPPAQERVRERRSSRAGDDYQLHSLTLNRLSDDVLAKAVAGYCGCTFVDYQGQKYLFGKSENLDMAVNMFNIVRQRIVNVSDGVIDSTIIASTFQNIISLASMFGAGKSEFVEQFRKKIHSIFSVGIAHGFSLGLEFDSSKESKSLKESAQAAKIEWQSRMGDG